MSEVRLGIFNLNDAKRMKLSLERAGVKVSLKHDEMTCRRGCQVTVEMWCHQGDAHTARKMMQDEEMKLLEGHDVQWESLNEVFDSSKELAKCPACSESFRTSLSECPSCGLSFGVT